MSLLFPSSERRRRLRSGFIISVCFIVVAGMFGTSSSASASDSEPVTELHTSEDTNLETMDEVLNSEEVPAEDPTLEVAAEGSGEESKKSADQDSPQRRATGRDEPKGGGEAPRVSALAESDASLQVTISQQTGTEPFQLNNDPGNDSGVDNDIIRTNDTISYTLGIRFEGADQTHPAVTFVVPQGQELVSMPPFCLAGSTVSPTTLPDPETPLTTDSWQSLPTQTISCLLSDETAGTSLDYSFLTKVRAEVPNGTTMDPAVFEVTSEQVPDPVATDPITQTVSAAPRFELSKQFRNVIVGNVACQWEPSRPCTQMTYPITVDAGNGGKGSSPLQSPIVFEDDLTPSSFYGEEVWTQMVADAGSESAAIEAYAPRVRTCGANVSGGVAGSMPFSRKTAGNTRDNSVRESGAFACTGPIGGPVTVTLTNTDTTAATVPTTTGTGPALPADSGLVVSAMFIVTFPTDAVSKFGEEYSPDAFRLPTHNEFKNVQMTGIDGTTVADDPSNNSADYQVNVRAATGSIGKYFSGIWGQPGNTPSNVFGGGVEGPPGSNASGDGQTQVMVGQAVQSVLSLGGTVPAGSGSQFAWTSVACDVWDPSRLTLAAKSDWVGGANGTYPSQGKPAWSLNAANVQGVTFEYSTGPAGPGSGSDCSSGTWVADPSDIVDPIIDGQGRTLWPGVNRVRVTYSSDIPGGGLVGSASLRIAIAQVVQDSSDTGPIGNWASQMKSNGIKLTSEVVADPARRDTLSSYTPTTDAGILGDRLLVGESIVRVQKDVQNPTTGEYTSSTVPQYTSDATVNYRLRPSLTAPIVVEGVTRQVIVEDCLPRHQRIQSSTHDGGALEPDLVQMGAPAGSEVSCGENRQYVRWNLGDLPVAQPIAPIFVTAEILSVAGNGIYTNDVLVSSPGDNSDVSLRSDDVQMQIVVPTGVKISKTVDKSVVEVNPDGVMYPRTLTWSVYFANIDSPFNVSDVDVIDVLPSNGVNGNSFEGSLVFDSATPVAGDNITVLYASAPGVDSDPAAMSNSSSGATVWCDAVNGEVVSGDGTELDCPQANSEVTALRFQREGTFAPGDEFQVDIDMTPVGNHAGDQYRNVTSGRAAGVSQGVGPAARGVDVIASRVGDRVWEDVNGNGLQDDGEPGVPGFPVKLIGTDLDGNLVELQTVTDTAGQYRFEGLASGDYRVVFDPNGLTSNSKFTPSAVGDDDDVDSDADVTTGETGMFTVAPGSTDWSWDAGLIIDRNVEIIVDKLFVGHTDLDEDHRSTVTYDIEVSNVGTADGTYDLADVVKFSGAIVIDSVTASNTAPGGITTDPAFDGVDSSTLVEGQEISAGETHSYRISVDARVNTAISAEQRNCTLTESEEGTGFLNEAQLTVDYTTVTDSACGEVPQVPTSPPETGADDEGDSGVLARAGGPTVWMPTLGVLLLLAGLVIVRRRRENSMDAGVGPAVNA